DGVHLVGNTRVPRIADHYAQAFRVLHTLKPDVFVAEHGAVFDLDAKAERARPSTGSGQGTSTASRQGAGPNPFVDVDGYKRFVDRSEQTYLKQLRAEQGQE